MKFIDTHFEDNLKKNLLHPKLNKIYESFPKNIEDMKNLIFYGPPGVGKYTQMLYAIKKYSPMELKYEKKISVNFNKNIYYLKISDIHYEIDMSLLGCQAKLLWNEIFLHIIDIITVSKTTNTGFIVCKYFEKINSELLEIFYSYMQNIENQFIQIKFILITESISFIPENILNASKIIAVEKPSKNMYNKLFKPKTYNDEDYINNIKSLQSNIPSINTYKIIGDTILFYIKNIKELKYINFRELLYDIFIYNIDIFDCIWYILFELIKINKINKNNIDKIIEKTFRFFQYYNNNYRPIYHLESYLLYLIININEC